MAALPSYVLDAHNRAFAGSNMWGNCSGSGHFWIFFKFVDSGVAVKKEGGANRRCRRRAALAFLETSDFS
jgi:hypothetical protein